MNEEAKVEQPTVPRLNDKGLSPAASEVDTPVIRETAEAF